MQKNKYLYMSTNSTIANKRKIFYLDAKQVTAGGLLLYKIFNDELFLLLVHSKGVYEDLGGKADLTDVAIENVVSREAYEESNCLLDRTNIENRIKCTNAIYVPRSKYALYIIEATKDEALLTSDLFGDKELHDGINRTILWITYDNFVDIYLKNKINPRLKLRAIFQTLKIINATLKKINECPNFL